MRDAPMDRTFKKTKHQSEATAYLDKSEVLPLPQHDKYQPLSKEEDQARTNVHYEQPAEFFYRWTGGEWNVYSCNLWGEGITTDTESQQAKLDLFAQLMDLKPGKRILDVGCGWAGPLVYLSTRYGVEGVGLTLSPTQKQAADERIARHNANVQVEVCHWDDYTDDQPFDAIYTDEVIVHFHFLTEYFKKAHALLCPGGIMLNKEFHYTSSRYKTPSRGEIFMNEIYGFTGNYRTLHEEMRMMDEAGFELRQVYNLPLVHYQKTMDRWLTNMHDHRARLVELVGEETYNRFRIYVKLGRRALNTPVPTMDIVVGRKPL
jgi:cyclopropane-fatty-acyl-phospholipid synthase